MSKSSEDKKSEEKVNKKKKAGKKSSKVKKKSTAKAAKKGSKKKKLKLYGPLGRFVRFCRDRKKTVKILRKRSFVTAEQEVKLLKQAFVKRFAPMYYFIVEAKETFWSYFLKVSEDFVDVIRFFSNIFIKIWFVLGQFFDRLSDKLWDFVFFLDKHKQKIFYTVSSVVSVLAISLIVSSSLTAYEYSYYGKVLGVAKNKQEVYRTIEILGDKLTEVTGANISINVERDIQFKQLYGFKLEVDSTDKIINTLTYMKDLQASGTSIDVNGESKVILQSEAVAKDVIQKYKDTFAGPKEGVEYSVIRFEQEVSTSEVQILLGDIWNPDEALKYLLNGTLKEPEEGEETKPLIDVYSVETATYEEDVEFGKDLIENSTLYLGDEEIVTPGILGKDRLVATIERKNGEEISKEVLSSERVSNPVNAVYYSGTKPIPETKGTGTFIFPVADSSGWYITGYFQDDYGYKLHEGVDLAVAIGTHVYASDGGVVKVAGYSGGYGYMVQIDHGGLYETIYGHLSEILVQEGQEVFQGQHIGNSGNTGNSTGPHLHFEMRRNGVLVDPLDKVWGEGYERRW